MRDTTRAFPSATAPLYALTISSASAFDASSISTVTSPDVELEPNLALDIGAGANAD